MSLLNGCTALLWQGLALSPASCCAFSASAYSIFKSIYYQNDIYYKKLNMAVESSLASIRGLRFFMQTNGKRHNLSTGYDPHREGLRILKASEFDSFVARSRGTNPILIFLGLFPLYQVLSAFSRFKKNLSEKKSHNVHCFFGECNGFTVNDYCSLFSKIEFQLSKEIARADIWQDSEKKLLPSPAVFSEILLRLQSTAKPTGAPNTFTNQSDASSQEVLHTNTFKSHHPCRDSFGNADQLQKFLSDCCARYGLDLFSQMHIVESPYQDSGRFTQNTVFSMKKVIEDMHQKVVKGSATENYFGKVWQRNANANIAMLKQQQSSTVESGTHANSSSSSSSNSPVSDLATFKRHLRANLKAKSALFIAASPSLENKLTQIRNMQKKHALFSLPGLLPLLHANAIYPQFLLHTDPGYYASLHIQHIDTTKNKSTDKNNRWDSATPLLLAPVLLAPVSANALALRQYLKIGKVCFYADCKEDAIALSRAVSTIDAAVKHSDKNKYSTNSFRKTYRELLLDPAVSVGFGAITLLANIGFQTIYTAALDFSHDSYATHARGYANEEYFFHKTHRLKSFGNLQVDAYRFPIRRKNLIDETDSQKKYSDPKLEIYRAQTNQLVARLKATNPFLKVLSL